MLEESSRGLKLLQETQNKSKMASLISQIKSDVDLGMLTLFIKSDNTTKLHALLKQFQDPKKKYNHLITDNLISAEYYPECLEYLKKLRDPSVKLEICLKINKMQKNNKQSQKESVLDDLTNLYSLDSQNKNTENFTGLSSSVSKKNITKSEICEDLQKEIVKLCQELLQQKVTIDRGSLKDVIIYLVKAPYKVNEQLLLKLSTFIQDYSHYLVYLLNKGKYKKAYEIFEKKLADQPILSKEICMNYLADHLKEKHVDPKLRRKAVGLLMKCGRERESYVLAKELNVVDYFVELLDHSKLKKEESLEICRELESAGKFERAGSVYRDQKMFLKSLECFFKAKSFDQCLKLISGQNDPKNKYKLNIECLELYEELIYGLNSDPSRNGLSRVTRESGNLRTSGFESKINNLGESNQFTQLQTDLMIGLYSHLGNGQKACQFIEISLLDFLESKQLKKALELLTSMQIKHFRPKNMQFTFELKKLQRVLESYLLVKPFVVLNNHLHATGLLERAARESMCLGRENHVNLLTSLVIEAFKVGLKGQAYHWALHLCKEENLRLVNEKCKSKIQKVALRPMELEKTEEQLVDSLFKGLTLETYMTRINYYLNNIGTILRSNGQSSLSESGTLLFEINLRITVLGQY